VPESIQPPAPTIEKFLSSYARSRARVVPSLLLEPSGADGSIILLGPAIIPSVIACVMELLLARGAIAAEASIYYSVVGAVV